MFCLQSASLPVLPLPRSSGLTLCPRLPLRDAPALCSKGSIHSRTWPWLQLQPALPRPRLPAPLCTPNRDLLDFPPARQGGLLEQGRSCCTDDPPTEQCPESSAAQVFITAKPCILGSTGTRTCLPKSRWWMGPREGLCAARPWLRRITGKAGKHRELGGVDLGWCLQPLVYLGVRSNTPTCWDSPTILFLTAAILSKSKRRPLAPCLPLAEPCAQPDSFPGSLAPLTVSLCS